MRRRWPIALAGIFIAILSIGFFVHRSHPDELASLRPYIVDDHYQFSRVVPGRPGLGTGTRWVTIKNAPQDLVLRTLRHATSYHGWVVEREEVGGMIDFWAHRGASKDMFVSPTIQTQMGMLNSTENGRHVSTIDPTRLDILEIHPLAWWEVSWLRIKSLGRDPFAGK